MSKLHKIGIIGCGGIANKKHMPALFAMENIEIVAFCDILPERAEKAKETFGTPDAKVYTDYKELLKDPTIDIVHICTSNRSHSTISVASLLAGKHVMCEKPMAINYEEAKEMLKTAKLTGKKLTVGYQCRHSDEVRAIKKAATNGDLGDIYYAKALALRRRRVPTWGVFLDKEEQGGGSLIDIGTHALDMTLWLMDNYKPKMVLGKAFHELAKQNGNTGNIEGDWDPALFSVEDSAFGFIVMENGAVINLESSWALNMVDTREAICMLCGTKAGADMEDGARINGVKDNEMYIEKIAESSQGSIEKKKEMALREMKSWIDAIDNNKDPVVLPEEAMVVTRILDAIYESSKSGKPVYFEDENA